MRTPAVDVRRLLDALGIEGRKAGGELRTHCPSPKHAKRPGPGSWQIRLDGPKAGQHVCYGCGFGGGPLSLVREAKGLGPEEARRFLSEAAGFVVPAGAAPRWRSKLPTDGPRLDYPRGSIALWGDVPPEVWPARDYLLGRGLTAAELERWRIAAVPEEAVEYAGRAIVPVVVGGQMVDFVARLYVERPAHVPKALSGRRDRGAAKEWSLWGYDELDPTVPIVHVCEGVWGAVAMRRAVPNVVAACGSAWSSERTELLEPWRTIVLVPDGDAAGSKLVGRAGSLRFGHDLRVADLGAGRQPDDLSTSELAAVLSAARPPSAAQVVEAKAARWLGK